MLPELILREQWELGGKVGVKGGTYRTGKTACSKVQGTRKKTLSRDCRGFV